MNEEVKKHSDNRKKDTCNNDDKSDIKSLLKEDLKEEFNDINDYEEITDV